MDCNIKLRIQGPDEDYFHLSHSELDGLPPNSKSVISIDFFPPCHEVLFENKLQYNAELVLNSSCQKCESKTYILSGQANNDMNTCGCPKNGEPVFIQYGQNGNNQGVVLDFYDKTWAIFSSGKDTFDIYASSMDLVANTVTLNNDHGSFVFLKSGVDLESHACACEEWDINTCDDCNQSGHSSITLTEKDLACLFTGGKYYLVWINKIDKDNKLPENNRVQISLCYLCCQ